MAGLISKFLDLLYPRRCPICDDIILPKGKLVCDTCFSVLKVLKEPLCFKCGKRLLSYDNSLCASCSKTSHYFDKAYSLWEYDDIAKKSISRFKYKGRREYAEFYADELYNHFNLTLTSLNLSLLIPIPIHKNRLRVRGFNQAELISTALSEKLKLPHTTDYLIRIKDTVAQKGLDPLSRKKNLNKAFSINKDSSFYNQYIENVLLIDDIFTTGSTVDACSKVLKEAGILRVFALCLSSVSSD